MNKQTKNMNVAGKAGPGRPKGSVNKTTAVLKDAIVAAFDKVGGVDYLARQAEENPVAFMSLIGRVIPLQVAADMQHNVKVTGALKWQAPQ